MDFKYLERKHGRAFVVQLRKDFKDFETHINNGGFVPGGGWCSCHERYDCPCWKERWPDLANEPYPRKKQL
jgi:hypothetical protein